MWHTFICQAEWQGHVWLRYLRVPLPLWVVGAFGALVPDILRMFAVCFDLYQVHKLQKTMMMMMMMMLLLVL